METLTAARNPNLPTPMPRTHVHTRTVVFRGYRREDGLWDIEGEMTDAKTYAYDTSDRGRLEAGDPIHDMAIRLTVDDTMKIKEVAVAMPGTPFPECQQAKPPLSGLIGHTLGVGWRKTIEHTMGGIRGCTHLRELLFNMATAAYQTIPLYRAHLRRLAGKPAPVYKRPLPHMGTCLAWDFDGPVVKRNEPEWFGWRPPK
jgi:hypothetical protein